MNPEASRTAPKTAGAATLACLVLALLLGACFEESPLVEPGEVYDPGVFMAEFSDIGMDSVILSLVDEGDTNRVIHLWSGRPDTAADFPVHVARRGERFHFRVQGFRDDRGDCFRATVRAGKASFERNLCAPRPFTVDSVDTLETYYYKRLTLRNTGRHTGWVYPVPRQKWIDIIRDSIWLDPNVDSAWTDVHFYPYLDRRIHHGTILLYDGEGRLLETVGVKARSTYAHIFHHDTLRFAADSLGHELMAFTPVTDNPDWFEAPQRPWLLVKGIALPATPGETTKYNLEAVPQNAPGGRTADTLRVYARGADSVAIDSVTLLFRW